MRIKRWVILARRALPLILTVMLGVVLLSNNQVLGWSVNDPEIKDLSGIITVRDDEGREELSLEFVYLNDKSMNYLWDPELVETAKKLIGDRNSFFLAVFAKQDTYFYPTSITFVQEDLQYELDSSDFIKASDTFSEPLRAGTKAPGFIFIPKAIDVYSSMKIYYDDDGIIFSVPKEEEKELDVEEQIKKLREEKVELEKKVSESKKRVDEIELLLLGFCLESGVAVAEEAAVEEAEELAVQKEEAAVEEAVPEEIEEVAAEEAEEVAIETEEAVTEEIERPKNVISVDLLALTQEMINAQYERAFKPNVSWILGVSFPSSGEATDWGGTVGIRKYIKSTAPEGFWFGGSGGIATISVSEGSTRGFILVGSLGYKLILGERFTVEPYLGTGYMISSTDGDEDEVGGFNVLYGLNIGYVF